MSFECFLDQTVFMKSLHFYTSQRRRSLRFAFRGEADFHNSFIGDGSLSDKDVAQGTAENKSKTIFQ